MARSGMSSLISELRRRTNAGTAEATVNGTAYWTDDQLQGVLDTRRSVLKHLPLSPMPKATGGSYIYKEYPFPVGVDWVEQNADLSGWDLMDSAGSSVGTSLYSVNYDARLITFSNDTAGLDYYLDVRVYELDQAAADVWESKAGFAHNKVDWQSDNHRVSANQEYQHCMEQAKKWRGKSGMMTGKFVRSDEI